MAYYLGNAPSRRPTVVQPPSVPPDELRDIYRQIDEEDLLTDSADDSDAPMEEEPLSPRRPPLKDNEDEDLDVFGGFDSHILGGPDSSPRRTVADYAKDEERLKRATSSRSPAFSRATVGNGGLTAEDLQRRDEEPQPIVHEDDHSGPALNLPTTWGSRASRSRSWIRNIQVGEESRDEKRETPDALRTRSKSSVDSSVGPISTTPDHSPGGRYLKRNALEPIFNRPAATSPSRSKLPSMQNNQQPTEGNTPNTPLAGYKTSTFTRPSPTKRDSHQLLRRLSRSLNSNPDQNEVQTPEPQKPTGSRIYDKTPVVTGAWIDTPVTERPAKLPEPPSQDVNSAVAKDNEPAKHVEPEPEVSSQRKEPSRQEKPKMEENTKPAQQPPKKNRPPLIKPNLPKSGLETVMEDVRAENGDFALGDDTIESLQGMLDEKPTEHKTEEEEEAESEKTILKKLESAKLQAIDPYDLDRLNDMLQSLMQNLSTVKRGLSDLEKQGSAGPQESTPSPSSPDGSKRMRHHHTGKTCESCGALGDGRLYATIPLPRLWKRNPGTGRIGPTRLGWFTLMFVLWFLSESTMCDYYSHPLFSDVCDRNCLMYDAPQFPFVLPTMLWRWSNFSEILAPVTAVFFALFKLAAQLLGLWDGYVDDAPRNFNLSGEIRVRGSQVTEFSAATASPGYNFIPKLWQGRTQSQNQQPSVAPSVPSLNLESYEESMDEDEFIG